MTEITTVAVIAGLALIVHAALAAYLYRSLSGSATEPTESAPENRRPSGDSSQRSGGESGPSQPTKSGHTPADPTADGIEQPSEAIQCPVCGVSNDPGFQFCRRCVSELSGRGHSGGSPDHTSPG